MLLYQTAAVNAEQKVQAVRNLAVKVIMIQSSRCQKTITAKSYSVDMLAGLL